MTRTRTTALAVAAGVLAALVTAVGPAKAAVVDRAFGADRYATAAELSKLAFTPETSTVYVATGLTFADALAAAPAAAANGAPILLVTTDGIPTPTRAELERLTPEEIVIVGGPAAVSGAVEAQLGSLAPTVRRLAGANRWATAQAISADTFSPGVAAAFVASGTNFPDALGGGAAAAELGGPVLLVEPGSTPAATAAELDRLDPTSIVVLGGPSAVSPAVSDDLARFGPVRRLAGPERFATSAGIARDTFKSSARTVILATGSSFPDALAGSASAAKLGGPLLLVNRECITRAVNAEVDRLRPERIILLGGTQVATDDVLARTPCPDAGATRLGPDRRAVADSSDFGGPFSSGSKTIAGEGYGHALYTSTVCTGACTSGPTVRWIEYDLGGAFAALTTTVGIASDSTRADDGYRFEILLDGVPLLTQEITGLHASHAVSLNVVGGLRLRFQVTRLTAPSDSLPAFGDPTVYTS